MALREQILKLSGPQALEKVGLAPLILGAVHMAVGALSLPENFVGFDNVTYTSLSEEEVRDLLWSKSYLDSGVALIAAGIAIWSFGFFSNKNNFSTAPRA